MCACVRACLSAELVYVCGWLIPCYILCICGCTPIVILQHHGMTMYVCCLCMPCICRPANASKCEKRPLTGEIEGAFDWLKNATYAGKQEIRHHEFDLWSYHVRSVTTSGNYLH